MDATLRMSAFKQQNTLLLHGLIHPTIGFTLVNEADMLWTFAVRLHYNVVIINLGCPHGVVVQHTNCRLLSWYSF